MVMSLSRRLADIRRVVLYISMAALLLTGCRPSAPHQFVDFSVGTVLTLTFYNGNRSSNARQAERLFAYAQDVEMRMSTSQQDYEDSELLRSNRNAGIRSTTLSADTIRVVTEGVRLSELTNGAFQIGVWPLTRLWDFSTLIHTADLPSSEEIAMALPLVGHDDITLDQERSTISFATEGMGVDVGGIAKGWIGDYFRTQIQKREGSVALIDIGGNIITVGSKKQGERWNIGIQDPSGTQGQIAGVLSVAETSVVTSGNYERAVVIDGVRYHHIIDPLQGLPVANELSSVTIVTMGSMYADALSTAVYVKGLAEGMAFVERLPGVEALFIIADNTIVLTDALRPLFTVHSQKFTVRE